MPLCNTPQTPTPRPVAGAVVPMSNYSRAQYQRAVEAREEAQLDLELARQRVVDTTDRVLAGEKPLLGPSGRKRVMYPGDVASELVNHDLFEDALEHFCVTDDPEPLADLKLRVGRATVARVMGYDPDELGFIS